LGENLTFLELGDPEVEDFHIPVRPKHDVLWLDVAMNNAISVSGGERTRDLYCNVDSFTQLYSPTGQTLAQRLAFNQFTRYVMN
jgi:hypothetical protein